MPIALMVDLRTLSVSARETLAARGDVMPPEKPEHVGGRNERQSAQNRIARKTKTWRNQDTAEAKQRARILYQLGLTPKPAPGEVALACARMAVGAAIECGTGHILSTVAGARAWHGPACFCGRCG
jgi:hypothetical protein